MIAPLRDTTEPATPPRAKQSLRRARRWIRRTLIEQPAEPTPPRHDRLRIALITGWIVLVAAAYFARLLFDFTSSR
jgi:hypothetical protein